MKARIAICLSLLLLLSLPAYSSEPLVLIKILRVESLPPLEGPDGEAFLIGPGASNAWSGRENQIARRDNSIKDEWIYQEPAAGLRVLNLELNEEYTFVDSAAGNLWPGSKWASVTSSRLHPANILTKNSKLSPDDNNGWFALVATQDCLISLPSPFSEPLAAGMSVVVEQADQWIGPACTFEVDGGFMIRLPDGSSATSWTTPIRTGTKEAHVFRLTAGNNFAQYHWYVSEF